MLNPEPEGPRSKCISVFDVAGVGLGSITGPSWAFLSASTKLLGDHYPERAQNVLIVNAPAVFAAVWSIVKPLINEATRAKVRLAKSSEVPALFAEFAEPDQIPREYGGTFDSATAAKTTSFQQSRCLTTDGVVGSLTWNALIGRTTNCGGGGTGGASGSSSSAPAASGPAARLLAAHRAGTVTLWNQTFGRWDGADPLSNMTDAAAGRAAKRSCYGTAPCGSVYVQSGLLNGVAALRERYGYRFFVSTIAGGSHSSGSYHYAGRAFDVDEVNGTRINGNSSVATSFMNACRALGAVEVFGPSNDPAGHWDHLHCAW
jgi:hypothetical protein